MGNNKEYLYDKKIKSVSKELYIVAKLTLTDLLNRHSAHNCKMHELITGYRIMQNEIKMLLALGVLSTCFNF